MKWHSCCPPHNLMESTGRLLFFCSFSFFFFLFFSSTASSGTTCSPSSCGPGSMVPKVRFPFRLKDRQNDMCGYSGFDLSCNNQSQTILNLPHAGEFIVNGIDYINQWIYINDPYYCLPKRILNFSLSGSRFRGVYSRNFTFLNCSSGMSDYIVTGALPIYCLSKNPNYTVTATTGYYAPSTCQKMKTVRVPVQWSTMDLTKDLQLTWRTPSCGPCEAAGGTCGFKGDTDEIECSNLPSRGLPRSAKYGIIIGLGIPGFVFFIGLACYIGSRIRTCGRGRQLDAELSNPAITSQPAGGLDGPTIESYPKTVLGESGRLPKPSDGTCPICLAEYLPKETLRTIPECNHYFHATCIDEWLKMNASCPLCRNSPAESSVVTPCSSMSFSSSSSSSLTS